MKSDDILGDALYVVAGFMALVMFGGALMQFGQALRWWGPPNASASVGGALYLLFLAGFFTWANRRVAASRDEHVFEWPALLVAVPTLLLAFLLAYYVVAPTACRLGLMPQVRKC